MQNSHPPAPRMQSSSEYLMVRIDKRLLLFLFSGLAIVATGLGFLLREPSGVNQVPAAIPPTDSVATTLSRPLDPSSAAPEPVTSASRTPAREAVWPVENRSSSYGDDRSATARPPASPAVGSPAIALAEQQPLPSPAADPPPTNSSSADNLPTDPPANPDPPSDPDPRADALAQPADQTGSAMVTGAGAVFPYPLYSKWFDEFYKVSPHVQFNYQAVGSAAGFQELGRRTVDFGGTDIPINDQQQRKAGLTVLHVPSVIGASVPVFNLPGIVELGFTPEILAGIFSGRIAYWNDSLIAAVNPTKNLPELPIVAIHRSDGCATTFLLTEYLSKVSLDWQQTVGWGTSVHWPIGLGGIGNEGVASLLKQIPGSIAYVDFQYAAQNQIPFGRLRNRMGKFIKANAASLTAAGSSANNTNDFRVSISNSDVADAYPISGFTWILVPVHSRSASEARDLSRFLRWMLTKQSQAVASSLGYAPLPEELAARIGSEVSKIR